MNNKPRTIFRAWEVYISVVLLCNPGSLGWFFDAFLSAKLKWMRHFQLGRVLINFGFPSLSFTKSAGSVSVAGPLKLRWLSHPTQYYLHVPNVSIYRWIGVRILWTSLRVGSKREQSQVIYLVYLLYEGIILFEHLLRNLMWKLRVPIQTMLFYSIRTVVSTLNLGHLCSILQNFALIGLLH